MRMNDVIPTVAYQSIQFPKCLKIRERTDVAAQLRNYDKPRCPPRAFQKVPFWPVGHTSDKRRLILRELVEALDRKQSILLGASDDQPRDNVQYPDGLAV